MKNKFLMAALLITPFLAQAQSQWVGPATGDIYYNNGNVGIGTNAPSDKLSIEDNSTGNVQLQIRNTSTASGSGVSLRMYPSATGNFPVKLSNVPDSYGANVIFNLRKSDYSYIDAMMIRGDGNIGIGTVSPDAKLTVYSSDWNMNSGIKITSSGAHFQIRPTGNGSNWDWELIQSGNFGNLYVGRDTRSTKLRGLVEVIDTDNSVKIRLNKNGNTYFNGGNVGIGISNPTEKLVVAGTICATEVKVSTVPCSDYVFEPDYPLLPLSEVETHIKEKKHLPGIPSAEEFKQNGVGVGEMDDMLLRKVEELTLYVIELQKQIKELKENQ